MGAVDSRRRRLRYFFWKLFGGKGKRERRRLQVMSRNVARTYRALGSSRQRADAEANRILAKWYKSYLTRGK